MPPRYRYEALRQFAVDVFIKEGVPHDEAEIAADVLMWASVRGVDTHGIRNTKRYYVDGIRNGAIRPDCKLEVTQDNPSTAATNAHSSLGLVAATKGMQMAIEKAEKQGVGMVTIQQSQHFGAAGAYAHQATEHGMLGIAMTGYFFQNGQSRAVVPYGGIVPMLSTNPIAFACPCADLPPFVLDMSTSVVPVNRLELMSERGKEIPEGWGLDAASNPTVVPDEFEAVLPLGGMDALGGHKGFGLAMMVQILTGVLSSAWKELEAPTARKKRQPLQKPETVHAGTRRQPLRPIESRGSVILGDRPEPREGYAQEGVAQFFAAIKIDQFMPVEVFEQSLRAMLQCINDSEPADGNDRVRYAGQPEAETKQDRLANGVPLEPSAYADLKMLSDETSIPLPSEI